MKIKTLLATVLLSSTLMLQSFAETVAPVPVENPSPIKQQMEQNFGELMSWVKTTATGTTNFISEQTPILIKEYLQWCFWNNAVNVTCCVALLAIFIPLFYHFSKKAVWDKYGNCEDISGIYQVISGIASLLSVIAFVIVVPSSIKDMVKVKVAPRVVIFEKTKEIFNK